MGDYDTPLGGASARAQGPVPILPASGGGGGGSQSTMVVDVLKELENIANVTLQVCRAIAPLCLSITPIYPLPTNLASPCLDDVLGDSPFVYLSLPSTDSSNHYPLHYPLT